MKSSKLFFAATAGFLLTAAVQAARIDFNDPRRALGREDDIRIDAQLLQDTISANSAITVTYQIENLSKSTVAIADKESDVSYDYETRTVTLSIGAEVPTGTAMPRLSLIRPGEKRVFAAGGTVHVILPQTRSPWTAVPQFVQIKVNVLKDVAPFTELIALQQRSPVSLTLPNEMFDTWVNSVDAVFLNAIPVRWNAAPSPMAAADASHRAPGTGRF